MATALVCAASHASELGFNRHIRPILSENCFLCHGQDPDHRGGDLRLDLREEAVALRDGIAAIVPGDPENSEVIRRIVADDPMIVMPPPEAHMPAMPREQIEILKRWITEGAEYEPHWAFVTPKKADVPEGAHPVDHFINKRLAEENLAPNGRADDATLVRRIHLDLTGLPANPSEIDAYLADPSPDRWERIIPRLMESPHFAERMALPWLDGARYSDTHGYSIDDHRDMWAWRDWVIHAFQTNRPYDQFVLEQIAGDLIPGATPDQIAATGFLRNSMNTHEGGIIAEEYRAAYTHDKVDAVSTSILGLTMKCAQCHDHKYDPISQKEYFQMYAFFNTSSYKGMGATNASSPPVLEYASPLGDGGMSGLKARIAELEFLKLHPTERVTQARDEWAASQPQNGGPPSTILATPPAERTAEQWTALNDAFQKSDHPLAERMAKVIQTLDEEIKVIQSDIDRGKTTVMVMDHDPAIRKTHILIRGAYDAPGEEVAPGVPAVLPPLHFGEHATRLDFAKWITASDHPLTARVVVNRLWQMIFGRGIVESAGDFGNQGSWPSHPELLDWLAVDFVDHGWDLRHTLRTILSSETYQRSATAMPEQLEADPRNELLARSPRTRLDAEIIRDQALAIGGLLNLTIGGPGVHPPQPELWSEISHFGWKRPFTSQIFLPGRGDSQYRRSLYTFWKRTSPPPVMAIFDAPTRETCAVVRNATNTPLQALVLLNEPQFVEAGNALGQRMIDEGGDTAEARIAYGFRLATGRNPDLKEMEILTSALDRNLSNHRDESAAYGMIGSTLLNLDEFINRP
ncbi:MAG: PSD1 and planctomycete cytochrome C domain-containing protein [Luteolibacter sp.]